MELWFVDYQLIDYLLIDYLLIDRLLIDYLVNDQSSVNDESWALCIKARYSQFNIKSMR